MHVNLARNPSKKGNASFQAHEIESAAFLFRDGGSVGFLLRILGFQGEDRVFLCSSHKISNTVVSVSVSVIWHLTELQK